MPKIARRGQRALLLLVMLPLAALPAAAQAVVGEVAPAETVAIDAALDPVTDTAGPIASIDPTTAGPIDATAAAPESASEHVAEAPDTAEPVDSLEMVPADPSSDTPVPDTRTPDTTMLAGPAGAVTGPVASFTFSADADGTGFECALDDQDFARCQSPAALSALGDGAHAFRVRAVTANGQRDATPASSRWIVDATGPVVTLRGGPGTTTRARGASFELRASEQGASFMCSIDSPALTPCTSQLHLTQLPVGSHTLVVIAIDRFGNASSTAGIHTWTIIAPRG